MYYGPQIILETGITIGGFEPGDPRLGILLNIPLALINFIGSIVTMIFIDKLGRRWLLLRSVPVMMTASLLVALAFYLSIYKEEPAAVNTGHYLAILCLALFLIGYSIGWGSTPWTVNTEIYPIHLIEVATTFSTSTNWISNFVMSTYFLQILQSGDLGHVLAFVIIAGFQACAFASVYFFVPETKGNTILENVANFIKRPIKDVNDEIDVEYENNYNNDQRLLGEQ